MRIRAAERKRASDHKGVYRCGRKWKSQIQCNGVQYYLGVFSTEEEAVQEYTKAATRLGKVAAMPGVGAHEIDKKGGKPTIVSIPYRELDSLLNKLELGKVTVQLSEYQLLAASNSTDQLLAASASNSTDKNNGECIIRLWKKREALLESILKYHNSSKAAENFDV
jgi:hypothetical protein